MQQQNEGPIFWTLKQRFEELKTIVAKIDESMSRVSDLSIDLELEKLITTREKLQTCIEDIRDEYQERVHRRS